MPAAELFGFWQYCLCCPIPGVVWLSDGQFYPAIRCISLSAGPTVACGIAFAATALKCTCKHKNACLIIFRFSFCLTELAVCRIRMVIQGGSLYWRRCTVPVLDLTETTRERIAHFVNHLFVRFLWLVVFGKGLAPVKPEYQKIDSQIIRVFSKKSKWSSKTGGEAEPSKSVLSSWVVNHCITG